MRHLIHEIAGPIQVKCGSRTVDLQRARSLRIEENGTRACITAQDSHAPVTIRRDNCGRTSLIEIPRDACAAILLPRRMQGA